MMRRRSFLAAAAASAAASLPGRPASAQQQAPITGAGGWLPKPLYDKWAQMAREGTGI